MNVIFSWLSFVRIPNSHLAPNLSHYFTYYAFMQFWISGHHYLVSAGPQEEIKTISVRLFRGLHDTFSGIPSVVLLFRLHCAIVSLGSSSQLLAHTRPTNWQALIQGGTRDLKRISSGALALAYLFGLWVALISRSGLTMKCDYRRVVFMQWFLCSLSLSFR